MIEPGANQAVSRDKSVLRGRVAILYALSRPILVFPFAALCMAVSLMAGGTQQFYAVAPLALLSALAMAVLNESLLRCDEDAEAMRRLESEKRLAEEARETAEANERSRSAFISNISHELRTPINAILGMAQLLERGDLEKAQRDHVKVLLQAGSGLKTLLDDIIALAQHSDAPLAAPREGCDAGQAARTVVRLLQPNAWEKRLRLSVNIASGLPHIAADSHLLRRVFLKLVGNAIKFTERGTVEIALDSMTDATGGKKVRFCITDTGPGIPAQLLATIFEPFGQSGKSNATRHAGAGIGLAVAKRLVESIGGTIGVESEPGMGASFWVVVPATQMPATEEAPEEEQVIPPSGLSLLVYLPDDAMRAEMERLLGSLGNSVTIGASLAQAATMSARGGFSLIIAAAAAADALAATPGQRTPILALATHEEHIPDGADVVLRWPARENALYSMMLSLTAKASGTPPSTEDIDDAIDGKAISELEKSLGFKTLIDILQSYLHTAEELAVALSTASGKEDWNQTGRVAQDFAGAAGGLGLSALTAAARVLAQGARDGAHHRALSTATDEVLSEHRRVHEALRRLYPDLAA